MMKMQLLFTVVVLALVVILAGCTNNKQITTDSQRKSSELNKSLSPSEAKKRLDTEKDIILLDVRTAEEYKEKHIPNSTLISLDALEAEASKKLPDKTATIFVYCRSGRRSASAYELLRKMGYSNVYDIGGIINWPYETES